jgi:hypothetical protein
MVNKPGAGGGRKAAEPEKPGRIKQIRMNFKQIGVAAQLIRKSNPRALPIVAGAGVGTAVVLIVAGLLTGLPGLFIPLGVLLGVLVAALLFVRFAQSSMYSALEGQPGAAAEILMRMRGNWTITPAITGNRNMDVVHRAVGKPGVVLIGEGNPSGLGSLLAAEKKRVSRVAYDVPIYDIQVGDGNGRVPIRKLQMHLRKLPNNLKGPAVADLNSRLKALPQSLQMPKGPPPRGARMPRAPRPKTR